MVNTFLSQKLKNLSFIAIIMVVYLHAFNLTTKIPGYSIQVSNMDMNTFVQTFISQGITRIAVPLFFLISGYLFFFNIDKPTKEIFLSKFKTRFHSLLIPFMFWSLLALSTFFILQSISIARPFFTDSKNLIANFTFYELLNRLFIDPIAYQFWFIKDLIIYIFLTPLIYWLIINVGVVFIAPFFICWIINFDFFIINSEGIFFFIVGSYFSLKKINLICKYSSIKILLFTLVWILFTLYKTYIEVDAGKTFVYLHKLMILIGVFSFWNAYDVLIRDELKTILLRLSKYTFFIYAIHEPALTMLRKISLKLLGVSPVKLLIVYLIDPLIIIICALVVAKIIKEKTPLFYSIITGGRSNNQRRE